MKRFLMIIISIFIILSFAVPLQMEKTEGIMPYCTIDDLIAKTGVDTLKKITKTYYPDKINQNDYNNFYSSLGSVDKTFVDSIYQYDAENDLYSLNQINMIDEKRFFKILIAIEKIDKIENALENTSNLIDGYLVGRYTVPISPTPDNIRGYAAHITIAELLIDSGAFELEADKAILKRKDEAIKFLENVAKGTFNLPLKSIEEGQVLPSSIDNILIKSKKKLDTHGYI